MLSLIEDAPPTWHHRMMSGLRLRWTVVPAFMRYKDVKDKNQEIRFQQTRHVSSLIVGEATIPDGFLRISDGVHRLALGMWGNLGRSFPEGEIKRTNKGIRVGLGVRKQRAAGCFRTAALKGGLRVYVFSSLLIRSNDIVAEPEVVPTKILERLISPRGMLPDHAIRPSLKTTSGDAKTLALLDKGVLLVRTREFNIWYRSQHAKGRWASQHSRKKPKQGRPSTHSGPLRNAVLNAMRKDKLSIAELHRRLKGAGHEELPSVDTLGRVVDELYCETGEPELLRNKRSRRKRA